MKKTFESFHSCLELREIIFLRTLPSHTHLVPALDIFLDPITKKLHICMEYMDGNLYQLMKARDHKPLDGKSVKSILFQILGGLDHIHSHDFFHRDIKPENILVSTSAPHENSTFSRYSALVTPPSTPPTYSIKIADFGLARETHSKLPYTTYVSTRWYRAPEVLLRAGEYSAPVDIWAIGAMAVEIATLKPLFPGGNEVDQVWRVCEIMGSPGNWYNKAGTRVGGGDWREGTRLAQKLGFAFPKMAPHSMETILQAPQWPAALSHFVTWCLMWDPKNRPTSKQALEHEYFADAVDPLRPKSSASRLLGRKHSDLSFKSGKENEPPTLNSKASWFRRSLIQRESAPAIPQQLSNRPTAPEVEQPQRPRPAASKRATWTNGTHIGAPMPILPSIRPISPLSNAVTAQGTTRAPAEPEMPQQAAHVPANYDEKSSKKIGRQLSVNSHGNHYADIHRAEAERALNGNGGLMSPPNGQKESFFSHLRKRARRFSGRHGLASPHAEDVEANAGSAPWSNRSSMAIDFAPLGPSDNDFSDLDKALQNVRYSLDRGSHGPDVPPKAGQLSSSMQTPRRVPSMTSLPLNSVGDINSAGTAPISTRTRRALQMATNPMHRYETPEEEDELLDEALNSASRAARRLDRGSQDPYRTALGRKDNNRQSMPQNSNLSVPNPYPTPSPSAKRDGVHFGQDLTATPSRPLNIHKARSENDHVNSQWPTPPYEENEWASSANASLYAIAPTYR